ncbi:MAG: hypothetical protein O2812_05105, partial [Chloroflexi bacterium]|nr:hypothetical protein [Chloroflexota bacterium]
NVGILAGVLTMVHQFGGAGAVFIAGVIFTATGSYTPIFIASIALLVGAGFLSLTVRERAYSSRFQPAFPAPEAA